jgi:hypothetical protein
MKIEFINVPDKESTIGPYYWNNIIKNKQYEVISDYERDGKHFFLISNYRRFQEIPMDENVLKV